MSEPLLTIPEAAEILRVTPGWLGDECRAGRIAHTRIGRHRRFTPEQLQAVIDANRVGPDSAHPSQPAPAERDGWARSSRQQSNRTRRPHGGQ